MDALRGRTLAVAGRLLEERLAPAALAGVLRDAVRPGARADTAVLRDVARLRAFLGGPAIQSLMDAPWLPIYLLVITLMHPLLGAVAAIGALVLGALGVLTERLTRTPQEQLLKRVRAASRRADALTRNAEVIHGMGMGRAAVAAWAEDQDAVMAMQAQLAARSARLAALARVLRQSLQIVMLGVGAWLVIGARCVAGHDGRGDRPARARPAAGRAPDRRLEAASRGARRVAPAERATPAGQTARASGAAGAARRACRSSASSSATRRTGRR